MITLLQKRKRWQIVSIASAVLLAVAFILLFYSLTALNGCLEKSISDISVSHGLCTIPGLKSAVSYNSFVIVLIVISSAGLITGIVKVDRITKEIDKEEEEEPPTEVRGDAYLPQVGHGTSRDKSKEK